jgi:hypothetical protein
VNGEKPGDRDGLTRDQPHPEAEQARRVDGVALVPEAA